MNTMIDRDGVLRACAEAASSHASEVRAALDLYLAAEAPSGAAFAAGQLRAALVALAAGHERTAHDGSTFVVRRDAARRALAAWDGPTEAEIEIAGQRIPCSHDAARAAGYHTPITESDGRLVYRGTYSATDAPAALVRALAEGHRGEHAVRRAAAIRSAARDPGAETARETARIQRETAEIEARAAGMRLAAEREVSRRAGK